jgi:predicted dienelactone hydrolase
MRTLVIVGLALTALAPAAFADDPCLTGASELGDRRALASLRDATDAECPCATTGARRTYQRCARGVLSDAIGAASLRPECSATARKINKASICGTNRTACARTIASAPTPVTCKIRRSVDCRNRGGATARACPNETHCADVVNWTAGTCTDTRDDGPYAVGYRIVTFTKPSVVDPMQMRPLETYIFYPAGPGGVSSAFGAFIDAPVDPGAAPYPILMFSHGSCGYPAQSIFLETYLASHGFIVVAPPHPGNTIDEFPSCGTPAAQAASYAERPADISFVLTQMLAADQDSGSPFFGAIDETRIGMSGHSFGGLTTYLVVANDPRPIVAMPMAPAVPGTPVLTVPSLTMLGQVDTVVDDPAIRTAYADALPPKYLVEIADAGHYAFSDFCFPGPDCDPPTTLTQDEAHELVRRYVLPFLEVHLAGIPDFGQFLAPPAVSGVELDRVP